MPQLGWMEGFGLGWMEESDEKCATDLADVVRPASPKVRKPSLDQEARAAMYYPPLCCLLPNRVKCSYTPRTHTQRRKERAATSRQGGDKTNEALLQGIQTRSVQIVCRACPEFGLAWFGLTVGVVA